MKNRNVLIKPNFNTADITPAVKHLGSNAKIMEPKIFDLCNRLPVVRFLET